MTNMTFNTSGYDLYEVTKNHWVIDTKNGYTYEGTLREVTDHMTSDMGFYLENIVDGLECLADDYKIPASSNNNAIHFGIYKRFIFTFEKKLEGLKKVG